MHDPPPLQHRKRPVEDEASDPVGDGQSDAELARGTTKPAPPPRKGAQPEVRDARANDKGKPALKPVSVPKDR